VNVEAPAAGRALQLAGVALVVLAGVVVTVAGTPGPALAVTAPSATVTPASGVADGQVVTVSASGLPANRTIQVEECAGTIDSPPPDNTACDGVTLDSSTDSDDHGDYANSGYVVYTRPSSLLSSPATITCDASHPCVLYVGVDQNNFSSPHAFAALTFAANVTTSTTAPPASTTSTTAHPSSSSTTSTTAHGSSSSTTSTTAHRSSTTTTTASTCSKATSAASPLLGTASRTVRSHEGCGDPGPATTDPTTGTSTVGLLQSGATTTTTAAARLTNPTQPGSDPLSPTGLRDSGDPGNPALGTGTPDPAAIPELPRTGGPHAAGLLAVAGLAVVLGGTELRRRILRPGSEVAR
jgi:Neocarzinostatin family